MDVHPHPIETFVRIDNSVFTRCSSLETDCVRVHDLILAWQSLLIHSSVLRMHPPPRSVLESGVLTQALSTNLKKVLYLISQLLASLAKMNPQRFPILSTSLLSLHCTSPY